MPMDPFHNMNVFFVVTTITVVLVGILVIIALVYIVRLLSTINHIATEVEEEAKEIRGDIGDVRRKAKKEGLRMAHLLSFFGKRAKRAAPRITRKKRTP